MFPVEKLLVFAISSFPTHRCVRVSGFLANRKVTVQSASSSSLYTEHQHYNLEGSQSLHVQKLQLPNKGVYLPQDILVKPTGSSSSFNTRLVPAKNWTLSSSLETLLEVWSKTACPPPLPLAERLGPGPTATVVALPLRPLGTA